MKLKPIFASLMVLGLAAPAAFADAPATANASTQSQLDAMKAQLNKMEAVVNQNSAGGFQQAADWTSRITISGLLNVDGYASNTTPNFGLSELTVDGHSNNIAVNNANLFVDALVNDWTNVHLGLAYSSNRSTAFSREAATPTFDEGYVTIANFTESPLFFRAGREYLPFGVYNRYPMVQNPTQLLSETTGTAAQAGFVSPVGVYGSVYGFRGLKQASDPANRPRVNTWGADLGYAYSDAMYGLKLDAGYINNFNNVNYVAAAPIQSAIGYTNRIGGLALSADGNAGPFDAALRYVTALQGMTDALDIHYNQNAGTFTATKAEPYAYGAELGYTFPVLAHQSRAGLGYQHTSDTSSNNIGGVTGSVAAVGSYGLPKNRYYGNYTVNVSKWTDVGFELYHDRDYSVSHGGTGTSATVGVLQLGVKFA